MPKGSPLNLKRSELIGGCIGEDKAGSINNHLLNTHTRLNITAEIVIIKKLKDWLSLSIFRT